MKQEKTSISVIVPAFNEESCIQKCILSLENELKAITEDFEIIVINDASTDNTEKVVQSMTQTREYLRIVSHIKNQGLGSALRSGFSLASKDIVFYSDADLPFDFFELHKAVRILQLKDADLILGFRHDRTDEGIVRMFYSFAYNILIRILFGVRVKDINFSFKLVRRQVLWSMDLKSTGSFIDAEIVIKAYKKKLFFCQIGIDYLKRKYGQSTLASPKVIKNILEELVKFYPNLISIKPVK